jgi:hypothetical protein
MRMNHYYLIRSCYAHRGYEVMFYFVCDCGIHSQCYGDRKTAEEMAGYHVAYEPPWVTTAERESRATRR